MDATHFDQLARTLSTISLRRHMLPILAGALSVALPVASGRHDAVAKRKRRKKKKKKRCTPDCAGKVCGDNGCGGVCGVPCPDTRVCQDGVCVCAPGREACGGECPLLCSAGRVRNPLNCSCCRANQSTCAGMADSSSCCSGNCAGTSCIGRDGGVACTFDAQCQSNDCNDFCANP